MGRRGISRTGFTKYDKASKQFGELLLPLLGYIFRVVTAVAFMLVALLFKGAVVLLFKFVAAVARASVRIRRSRAA